MSVIFPGNYVAHLNAYREQGVLSIPGVEFYRLVGAVVIDPDNDSLTTGGVLPAGNYTPQILSPDLRQDDKPRLDKPMIVPAGAIVYRTAVSAPGVKAVAAADTITLNAPTPPAIAAPLAAEASLFFPENGISSALLSIVDGTASGADETVTVTTSDDFTAEQNPSVGACRTAPSAILVEVCYYVPAPAPDYDDVHIPYGIESGQGY